MLEQEAPSDTCCDVVLVVFSCGPTGVCCYNISMTAHSVINMLQKMVRSLKNCASSHLNEALCLYSVSMVKDFLPVRTYLLYPQDETKFVPALDKVIMSLMERMKMGHGFIWLSR